MTSLLWVGVPYAAIAIFVVGHVWRYRYDKFGWTTRSSQLYERRLLRWGSPLFHFGILLVALGHIGGLLIPESWTEAVGISETAYHAVAFTLGTVAGLATVAGAAILIYRRRTVGPVFSATTRNDKVMYVLLMVTVLLGLGTTVLGNVTGHPRAGPNREAAGATLPAWFGSWSPSSSGWGCSASPASSSWPACGTGDCGRSADVSRR